MNPFVKRLLQNTTKTIMSKRKLNDYAGFEKVLKEAKNIVALTGAGISAESGIPVFRGAGGLWRNYQATSLATPEAFRANPSLVWEFYQYRRNVAFNAQPNNAHKALAILEDECKRKKNNFAVITQNVDGLHKRAGSEEIVELHGALDKIICTKCKHIEVNLDSPVCEALKDRGDPNNLNQEPIMIKDLPKCKKCDSLARPYIVWFGESLDPQVMEKARNLVENCDLCLIIGTSSVVYPAAMFAPSVLERGKPVAEFNISEEPANEGFTFHFSGKCGTTLPKALGIDL
ncbi:unnamed protein product [Brassicogethes aeneus]|uniref:NAD-dependent protein deacylase n=1 Tax=Brassicogethes aeneus TaxID=1431903 RepID=A0A9P0BFR4_BRAAE|nr:unnamed protein product [Brassicogethes aeneus]